MSFPRYPEYRDSGVEWLGEVPEHWRQGTIRRLVESVRNGTTSDQVDMSEATVPVSRIETISMGNIDFERVGHTPYSAGLERYRLSKGDILFSHINSLSMIGNAAIYEDDRVLIHGMNLLRICPMRGVVSKWLWYWLTSVNIRREVESRAKPAINQASISTGSVQDLPALIPPSNEQQKIAQFLDHETAKIDALIQEQQRLIELLKEKRKAVISHAVTKGLDPSVPMKDSGVEWLGEGPEHWRVMKFVRCVQIAEGQVDPKISPYSEMALIAPNHVEPGTGRLIAIETSEEQGAESGKYVCEAGNVIYSKIRPALRKVCLAPVDCLCSADMYPLDATNGLSNQYLLWVILSEPFSVLAVLESERVAMPKINREALNEVFLAVPPENEQDVIGHYVSDTVARLDRLLSESLSSITYLNERRSALISAAVTGKIDVRNWKPPANESAFNGEVRQAGLEVAS